MLCDNCITADMTPLAFARYALRRHPPLWSENILTFQLPDRGGVIRVEVKSNRFILSGPAVTVIKGCFIYTHSTNIF